MSAARYDVLIKNALLFDGSGSYPLYRDVAITQGRIAAIGKDLSPANATETVDATGKWLMPGMLDIHTHLDLEVEVNPGLGECVRHGTTAVVVGNCSLGTAFGAQRKDGADPIVDCFARVESMPKSVLAKCVEKITWQDTAGYLDHFKQIPLGPNIMPLIPHSMLRVEAMGLQDSVTRKATPAELERMRQLVSAAMQQGYLGLSLDSLVFHYLANDPNKEKRVPTQVADNAEIFPLVQILREHDRVLQSTPDNDNPLNSAKRFFWSSGRFYKKPLRVTGLVAIDFNPIPSAHQVMLKLAKILNSKWVGGKFHFQALSTNFRMWVNGVEAPIFEELPSTRALLACEVEDRAARLKLMNDPQWVKQFRIDMDRVQPKKGFAKILAGRPPTFRLIPEEMKIEDMPVKCWNGDTMADILYRLQIFQRSLGDDGAKCEEEREVFARIPKGSDNLVDFYLWCLREYDLQFRWWIDIANCRNEIVKKMLFDENTLPGFNDSGAHITNMAFYDGNLMTLKIAQAESLHKVAIAVKRLTKDPAQFFGVDVGEITPGAQADVVLINPDQLQHYETNDNRHYIYVPHYDAKCMVNRSDGVVEQVYINGVRVWENGNRYTEALGKQTLGRALTYTPRQETSVSLPSVA
jgi:N-acyl-D-aspartate/D-glutamate deacylase